MTGIPALDILLFLASLFISASISMAEFAISAASRSKLELLRDAEDHRARIALRLKDAPEKLQASVQIATTFLLIFSAVVIEPYVETWIHIFPFEPSQLWLLPLARIIFLTVIASLIAGLFLVFHSLFAKSLGTQYGDPLSLKLSAFSMFMTRLLSIPQILLTFFANVILKPLGMDAKFRESLTSEENLMDILEEGTKSGILNETEHELIESIFEFTDTTAREIMIPRKNVIAINTSMSPDEILEMIVEEGFTRMPVYRDSLDHIIGVIYAKDVLSLFEHKDLIILQDIIRPPFIVPETKPISELLREFQRKRIHLAVVVDEFGGTEGIITMEDILEEIVGDIRDEYDEEIRQLEYLPNGDVEVEGMMNIFDFNEHVDFTIPESPDYDTVGGFITTLIGRIPETGDLCVYHQLEIQVMEMEERRVKRVLFHPAKTEPEE
jgi:CBS domain containing-hemolysin-like protein